MSRLKIIKAMNQERSQQQAQESSTISKVAKVALMTLSIFGMLTGIGGIFGGLGGLGITSLSAFLIDNGGGFIDFFRDQQEQLGIDQDPLQGASIVAVSGLPSIPSYNIKLSHISNYIKNMKGVFEVSDAQKPKLSDQMIDKSLDLLAVTSKPKYQIDPLTEALKMIRTGRSMVKDNDPNNLGKWIDSSKDAKEISNARPIVQSKMGGKRGVTINSAKELLLQLYNIKFSDKITRLKALTDTQRGNLAKEVGLSKRAVLAYIKNERNKFELETLSKITLAVNKWSNNMIALIAIKNYAKTRGDRFKLVNDVCMVFSLSTNRIFKLKELAIVLDYKYEELRSLFVRSRSQDSPIWRDRAFKFLYQLRKVDFDNFNEFLGKGNEISFIKLKKIKKEASDIFTEFLFDQKIIPISLKHQFELERDILFMISDYNGDYVGLTQLSTMMDNHKKLLSDKFRYETEFSLPQLLGLRSVIMSFYWKSLNSRINVNAKLILKKLDKYRNDYGIGTKEDPKYGHGFDDSLLDDLYILIIETAGYDLYNVRSLPKEFGKWRRHHMDENTESTDIDDMAPTTEDNNLHSIPHMWMVRRKYSIQGKRVTIKDVLKEREKQHYLRDTIKELIFSKNQKISEKDIRPRLKMLLRNKANIDEFISRVNKIKEDPNNFVMDIYLDFYLAWKKQSQVRYASILQFI